MAWRIYYGDGSTYSDRDGPPEFAPKVDVQVIVQIDGDQQSKCHGRDFYCWIAETGFWHMTDQFGMFDYLFLTPGYKIVLAGRTMIRTEDYWDVMKRADKEGVG